MLSFSAGAPSHRPSHYKVVPPKRYKLVYKPHEYYRYITYKNHSYWSYVHQLSYRSGAPPCRPFYDRNRLVLRIPHFEESPNQYIDFETLDV